MHNMQTMPTPPRRRPAPPRPLQHQRGIAMFFVLVITVIIVGLSISLATGVFSEHKIARATADQAIARQGAEAALRDAELDLMCLFWNGTAFVPNAASKRTFCTPPTLESGAQRGGTGVTNTSTGYVKANGARFSDGIRTATLNLASAICEPTPSTPCGAQAEIRPPDFIPPTCRTELGSFTAQPALDIAGLTTAQPKTPIYCIELFLPTGASGGNTGVSPVYRIRARGYGRSDQTTVDLESLYRPFKDPD